LTQNHRSGKQLSHNSVECRLKNFNLHNNLANLLGTPKSQNILLSLQRYRYESDILFSNLIFVILFLPSNLLCFIVSKQPKPKEKLPVLIDYLLLLSAQ